MYDPSVYPFPSAAPLVLVDELEPGDFDLAIYVAPEDQQALDVWVDCRDKWLDALQRKSKNWTNTRRAYACDWTQFFAFWRAQNLMPWQVASLHVETWISALYDRKLSDSTVNRKLAALSSFYNYATYRYVLMGPIGEKALWEHPNPFRRAERVRIDPYGKAIYPAAQQVADLLNQIKLTTSQGWRDLALLMGMFVTTRRVSEWCNLRWRDVHDADDGGKFFEYRYKGGKIKRQKMPTDLWRIIAKSLEVSGRLAGIQDDDYLFVATRDTATRFRDGSGRPTVGPDYDPAIQPISTHRVNDLMKKYGRRAGIPDDRLHAHALRHAGARARHKSGADILELREITGHASIAILQVYIQEVLEQPDDRLGDTVLAQVLPNQLKFSGL